MYGHTLKVIWTSVWIIIANVNANIRHPYANLRTSLVKHYH